MKKSLLALLIVSSILLSLNAQQANAEAAQDTQAQTNTEAQETSVNKPKERAKKENKKAEKIDALVEYRKGRDLSNAGRTEEANAAFQKSIDACRAELVEKSTNMNSYVVLTWSLLGIGRYAECITECNKALKISPKEYRIIETMGEAKFYNKQYEESITWFEQYVSGAPRADRVPVAYFFIGEAYRILHQWEHADISYSTAIANGGQSPLWFYRLGQVKEKTGDKEGAKAAYNSALRLRPNYPDASAALKRL